MNKKLIILVFLLLFIPFNVKASNLDSSDLPYVINNYDININVNKNKTYDVTETISLFNNNGNIIYDNYIPLNNSNIRGKITNLKVNTDYVMSYFDKNYILEINSLKKGLNIYKISYTYNILDNDNNFNYSFITNKKKDIIKNVSFSITFPKKINKENIEFKGNNNILYSINDNTITGKYSNVKEGTEINLKLDNNYFNTNKLHYSNFYKLYYIVPVLLMIISYLLWNRYGKDDVLLDMISIYPPKELNSLELAYYYNGKINVKNVISLIPYLANKGYIKLEEKDGKYKIKKLKEYDGKNKYEKEFMKAISSNKISYKSINKILKSINTKSNNREIYNDNLTNVLLVLFMLMASVTISLIVPLYNYLDIKNIIFNIVVSLIFIPIIYLIFSNRTNKIGKYTLGTLTFIIMIIFNYFANPLYIIVLTEKHYIIPLIINIASIVIQFIILILMPKRTKFGNEYISEINGFKEFIYSSTEEDIKEIYNSNKNYYYDILSYVYSLDINKRKTEKFTQFYNKFKWTNIKENNQLFETLDNISEEIVIEISNFK